MTYCGREADLRCILAVHLSAYRERYGLSAHQSKVLGSIAACRTAQLGGHVKVCSECGTTQVFYNSCRDRHCPRCQSRSKEAWLSARLAELLPVNHYHLVFTVPEALRPLFAYNERMSYDLLFRLSWSSLRTLCAEERYLGARPGALSVLHTWGQKLSYHPHLHCLVPAGGLSFDGRRWRHPRGKNYLVSVRALSRLFRGRMVSALGAAVREKRLRCPPGFNVSRALDEAMSKEWVVYAEAPFGGAKKLVGYLARYVKRVAISNDRIAAVDEQTVRFHYRDYADRDRQKVMRLSGVAFIRRFVRHILPAGYCKVRYYGILSLRDRHRRLAKCRYLLSGRYVADAPAPPAVTPTDRCPHCDAANWLVLPLAVLQPRRGPPAESRRGCSPTPETTSESVS